MSKVKKIKVNDTSYDIASTWGNIEGTVADQTDVQAKLVSGTNIKTINNQSLLGSGNITIQGGGGDAAWGSITGNLEDQTDLVNELDPIKKALTPDTALVPAEVQGAFIANSTTTVGQTITITSNVNYQVYTYRVTAGSKVRITTTWVSPTVPLTIYAFTDNSNKIISNVLYDTSGKGQMDAAVIDDTLYVPNNATRLYVATHAAIGVTPAVYLVPEPELEWQTIAPEQWYGMACASAIASDSKRYMEMTVTSSQRIGHYASAFGTETVPPTAETLAAFNAGAFDITNAKVLRVLTTSSYGTAYFIWNSETGLVYNTPAYVDGTRDIELPEEGYDKIAIFIRKANNANISPSEASNVTLQFGVPKEEDPSGEVLNLDAIEVMDSYFDCTATSGSLSQLAKHSGTSETYRTLKFDVSEYLGKEINIKSFWYSNDLNICMYAFANASDQCVYSRFYRDYSSSALEQLSINETVVVPTNAIYLWVAVRPANIEHPEVEAKAEVIITPPQDKYTSLSDLEKRIKALEDVVFADETTRHFTTSELDFGMLTRTGVDHTYDTRVNCTELFDVDEWPKVYVPSGCKWVVSWYNASNECCWTTTDSAQSPWAWTETQGLLDVKSAATVPFTSGTVSGKTCTVTNPVKYKICFGNLDNSQLTKEKVVSDFYLSK